MRRIAIGTAALVLAAGIGTGTVAARPLTAGETRSAEISTATAAASADANALRRAFLGYWHLDAIYVKGDDGKRTYPFGKDAKGALTYSDDGRMAVAVWAADRKPFAIADQQKGTSAEYTAAVQSYIQYMGTFSIDRKKGTMSHHVEQSVFPNWNGSTQTRFFDFTHKEKVLTLTTPPVALGGTFGVFTVVWAR